MQDKFNFFVEIDEETENILKSVKDDSKKYDNMIVAGRATTSLEDRQGEVLHPKGFDFEDFLENGHINLEHFYIRKGDPLAIIGEPIEAHVKDNEFYVKGKLYKGNKNAEGLWDTLHIMKANNSTRKLGWSIEGNRLAVDPNNKKIITKAKINNIALTFNPQGRNLYADIAKGNQENDFVPLAYDEKETGGGEYLLRMENNGNIITVKKDFSIDIKPKSMTTDSIRPLIPEGKGRIPQWDSFIKAINEGMVKKDKIVEIFNKLNKKYPIN